MHRLIEWVTDLIDDYGESFIEAPLKTLSKTVSWIFSIVIGVMSVVAYIKFIAGGGYPHAIATIKNSEEGFFAGVGDTFTNGTVHMVANNGVYKALGIIFIVQIVLALIMLFFEGKIWKWILAIIDFILIAVSGIWSLVKYNQYNKLYASLEKLYDNEEIDTFMQETLAKLVDDTLTVDELIALTLETGKVGVDGMALLDTANTKTYGNPEITKVNIGVGTVSYTHLTLPTNSRV